MESDQKPKKANLLDHQSIKHILDESVTEFIIKNKGCPEDVRMSNFRLLIGVILTAFTIVAQFYKKTFTDNRNILIACIILYVAFNGLLQLIMYVKGRNVILFTCPPTGSFVSTGLAVTSKLPRFSDMYTLVLRSADPHSVSAKPAVEFTKSVTQWFTKDGVLVRGLFWEDVEGLMNEYEQESKKRK